MSGVVTQVEVATALALNTYGTEVALVMVLGFIMNLVFAKVTPFKAVFLTGQHFLYFACVLALVFIALGAPIAVTVICGGVVLGFCGAALPSLCQPFVEKLTGSNDFAIGHFNCIGYAFSGYCGKLFAKKNESRDLKGRSSSRVLLCSSGLQIFSVALFMVVLFYIVTLACFFTGHFGDQLANGKAFTSYFGNDIWWIWPFLAGLKFAAGMSVLVYGVRQFIAEITAAFVGISEKLIPDAKPAVDCPAIFPFAPNAVIIGFIGSFLGGLVAMALMVAFHSETIMIPAAGICFFSGGTCGVCGYAYGGWRGALLGSFLVGIVLCAGPLVLYPAFANLGIAGASFPNVDYNIVGSIIYGIGSIFAKPGLRECTTYSALRSNAEGAVVAPHGRPHARIA